MRIVAIGIGLGLVSGCWAGERAPLPVGPTEWEPIAGDPVGTWVVTEVPTDLACPDGDPARLWLARPDTPAGPLPVAVVFHGGAFDYPLAGDQSAGGSLRDPTRLDRDWADRRSWATLGMWASDEPALTHTGTLPLTLSRYGFAVLAVPNCWGDYGYNQADNDVDLDGFERRGGSLTRLAWELATVEGRAAELGVDLGMTPSVDRTLAVGLGHGGRSVGVLTRDPTLRAPTAVLLDSVDDDLRVYFDAPDVWAPQVAGLNRIWTGGRDQAQRTRLGSAPLPADTHLVVSAADPALPAGVVDELAAHVTGLGGTVTDTGETRHIQLAGDAELVREVLAELLGPLDGEGDTDSGDTDSGDTDG